MNERKKEKSERKKERKKKWKKEKKRKREKGKKERKKERKKEKMRDLPHEFIKNSHKFPACQNFHISKIFSFLSFSQTQNNGWKA